MLKQHTLSNGLTVLIHPIKTIPKVAIQLWYHVGSKDEETGQKGMAHFLEHMLFKGTQSLSELDYIDTVHTLAGSCNAFTSNDYTGYTFEFPAHQWRDCLFLLADTMRNCTFKQEALDSELGAVIQELKLYRDEYDDLLEQMMVATLIDDHPYHYPVIGLKQDLFAMTRQQMLAFYHTHYVPNNAALVIVGDVDVDEVIKTAEHYFGAIPANTQYKKRTFHLKKDVASKEVILYRDVAQSEGAIGFLVPGLSTDAAYSIDILSWLLANGKGSRLYKKLVTGHTVATDVYAYTYNAFDHAIFFIKYRADAQHIPQIEQLIIEEIDACGKHGFDDREYARAIKQVRIKHDEIFENYEDIAHEIGQFFWARNQPTACWQYGNYTLSDIKQQTLQLLNTSLNSVRRVTGRLLPIPTADQAFWLAAQEQEDAHDTAILEQRERTAPLEAGKFVHQVHAKPFPPFQFPVYQKSALSQGLTLLHCHLPEAKKVTLLLHFKSNYWYDPVDKQGLHAFMMRALLEGTKTLTAQAFADVCETNGISIDVDPGMIKLSMLPEDLAKGLELLNDMLRSPRFDKEDIERVRQLMIADAQEYYDAPFSAVEEYAKEYIYKDHPYAHAAGGTVESLERITHADIHACFKAAITPHNTRVALVGNCADAQPVIDMFSTWQGPAVPDVPFPVIQTSVQRHIHKQINRDQTVLAFVAPSIALTHPDFHAMLIFNELVLGGAQGSMSSKLFQLREQTGLFYTIKGSLYAGADYQPGMLFIKTIVSPDDVAVATQKIQDTFWQALDQITDEEIAQSIQALQATVIDYVLDVDALAKLFVHLDYLQLPKDYYTIRTAQLNLLHVADIKKSIHAHFARDRVSVITVGRTQ